MKIVIGLIHLLAFVQVIFLVPKVPLVIQQAKVLETHTSLRVRGYCGEMGVDIWDRPKWHKELDEHDVLVMTAQILYDMINHAHFSMDKV